MSSKPELDRLIDLQRLMLTFRAIKREIHLPADTSEQENDAEHSYTLAMAGWFLAPYFPHLDRNSVIRLCLAHDLVEVYAGDTFAYGEPTAKAGKQTREQAAAERLANEWPDFPELAATIQEYKTRDTEEARFVYALDKIMPAIVVFLAKGYGWHKHQITLDTFRAEKEHKVSLSPEVKPYYEKLYALIKSHPEFMPPSPSQQR